jgi:hypothetical protein
VRRQISASHVLNSLFQSPHPSDHTTSSFGVVLGRVKSFQPKTSRGLLPVFIRVRQCQVKTPLAQSLECDDVGSGGIFIVFHTFSPFFILLQRFASFFKIHCRQLQSFSLFCRILQGIAQHCILLLKNWSGYAFGRWFRGLMYNKKPLFLGDLIVRI